MICKDCKEEIEIPSDIEKIWNMHEDCIAAVLIHIDEGWVISEFDI
ncbi:hypothetical protein KAW18_02120 [candidate division WOR-3 bacterium]|nr:hypothetical protein [candidate division WOR-3 bacterium]